MSALLASRRDRRSHPAAERQHQGGQPGGVELHDPPRESGEHTPRGLVRRRIRTILAQPLTYHVCRDFKRLHSQRPLIADFDRSLSERTMLPAERENELFVRLNYCKFRADILRRQLPADWEARLLPETVALVAEIENYLAAASLLRDGLLRAFLKLAISLLGPFVGRQHGFEELLSEAAMALLRSVEMFDPDRGFRFSTYATPAVRRRLERYVTAEHKNRHTMLRSAHLDTMPTAARSTRSDDVRRAEAVAGLAAMLSRLDDREQMILKARFGLEPGRETQSLQEVAVQLGVCRERVRQLEARALEKLRQMPEAQLATASID